MHPIQDELNCMVQAGLPGAFVYTENADGISQFFTAGVADLTTGRRMTPDSRYRVGSTTKTFTAVITLQLIAADQLAFEQTVQQWLPELPAPNAANLTIEHLLRMRSGLFDFVDDPSLLSLDANLKSYRLQDVVQLGMNHPSQFLPGSRFEYCNTNYCVLEMIIERASGNSLQKELQDRILKPLGMSHSWYPADDDLSLPEPYIRGYEHTNNGWRECSQVFFGRGDGALISTALDQSRFFRALLDGKLLPDSLLTQMMTIIHDDPPADELYGLGLIADPLPIGTVWGHSGGGYGYNNYAYLHRETGRFVAAMINGSYGFTVPSSEIDQRPRFSTHLKSLAFSPE